MPRPNDLWPPGLTAAQQFAAGPNRVPTATPANSRPTRLVAGETRPGSTATRLPMNLRSDYGLDRGSACRRALRSTRHNTTTALRQPAPTTAHGMMSRPVLDQLISSSL